MSVQSHPQFTQSQPPPISPKMQEALTQIDMLPGEQIVYGIQADGFFLGTSPLLKMIASIQKFVTTITGGHIRVFLVVTNQRMMVLRSVQTMCGCQRLKGVTSMALAGVKEAGSAKDTQLCCINTRVVTVRSLTEHWNLVVTMSDPEMKSFVSNLSAVLVAHSTRAGV
jgi:hypothetical protein